MQSYYIQYTPVRRGLTGVEYLPQFLDENFPTDVSFDSVVSDGINYFGILSGTDTALANSLSAISGRFSVLILPEDVFIGDCYNNYNNPVAIEGYEETPPTFVEFMASHGVTVVEDDLLSAVKAAKINKFKQISKTIFPVLNDTLADISKVMVLLNLHYDDLTTEQKTLVDDTSASIKEIYTAEMGIAAYTKLLSDLQNILSDYYVAKSSVNSATTTDDVKSVIYK